MSRSRAKSEPADISALGARIEDWRSRKEYGGEPMPAPLWEAATELAKKYGINRISRGLRLSYTNLKKRVQESCDASLEDAPQFVQLESAPTFGTDSIVEIGRPDGSQLTIRREMSGSEILELSRVFCEVTS